MKLIVGLGNPGEKYAGNRHNIGFMAVDEMARGYSFAPWKKRFQGLTAEGQAGLERCILLKPSTYMNESGRAVGEAMRYYKIALADVIVIHDEIDLKPGAIRVKRGGGNAGHNGLKSITAHVGNDYQRVRLGVDHPGDKALVANYVLQDFAKSDQQWLVPLLEGVARGMAKLVEGSEAAFLSEAARGRKVSAPAAKLNGASAPEHVVEAFEAKPAQASVEAAPEPQPPAPVSEAEAPAADIPGIDTEIEALAAIVAAASSKPIEPLPAPAFAVREALARAPEDVPAVEHLETAIVEAEAETVIEARSTLGDIPHPSAAEAIPAPEPEVIPHPAATSAPEPEAIAHLSAAEAIQTPEPAPEPEPEPEPALHPAAAEALHAPEPQPTSEPESFPHPATVEAAHAPEPHPAPAPETIPHPSAEAIQTPEPAPEPEPAPHPAAAEAIHAPEPQPAAEPEPIPHPAAAAAPEPAIEPAPAAKPEPILEPQPEKLAPAPQPAAKVESAAVSAPAAKKAEAPKAAAKPQSAPPAKRQGNIITRWFRNRVRGGGSH